MSEGEGVDMSEENKTAGLIFSQFSNDQDDIWCDDEVS